LELENLHKHKHSKHKLEFPNIENAVGNQKLLQIKHHRKWATKNKSRSSLAMSKKEEKKALASSHTQSLQDFGKKSTYIFVNKLGVRV
jgi:hypothetical protein